MRLSDPQPTSAPRRRLNTLALLLFFVLIAAISLLSLRTPPVVPTSAGPESFSAERALEHVRVIAQHPHPTGSAPHQQVREYLLDQLRELGLDPTVQSDTVSRPAGRIRLHNIVAHIPGHSPTGTLMLSCHYDTVPDSPGAADDSAAVAAILETLRALQHHPPLRNNLVILFTDGEEIGLLGAHSFVSAHPLAADINVVLNFEARGTAGPVFMFQTSPGNLPLIREFRRAAPYPLANSLTDAVYRTMPNGTDLTVFMNAGMAGLDFAFIHQPGNYHTPRDDIHHLDTRSLQHQGSYMLPLTLRFGHLDLSPFARTATPPSDDAIYFNLAGHYLVHYPASLTLPFASLTLILTAIALILHTRRGLPPRQILIAAILLILAIAAGVLATYAAQWLLRTFTDLTPSTAAGSLALRYANPVNAALAAIAIAAFCAVYIPAIRRCAPDAFGPAASILFLALLILLVIALPAGSFLFLVPLAAWSLTAIATHLLPHPILRALHLTLAPTLTLLLFIPMTLSLIIAIPLLLLPATVALPLLGLSLCLPSLFPSTAATSPT